jgi:hypothetical protein
VRRCRLECRSVGDLCLATPRRQIEAWHHAESFQLSPVDEMVSTAVCLHALCRGT